MKYLLPTSCALSFLLLATLSAVPADDGKLSLQSPPDPYADAEDLNDALEILREKLRSDGKADFAALLSAKRVKQAIRTNAPRFSARRMLKEYVERFYTASVPQKPSVGATAEASIAR